MVMLQRRSFKRKYLGFVAPLMMFLSIDSFRIEQSSWSHHNGQEAAQRQRKRRIATANNDNLSHNLFYLVETKQYDTTTCQLNDNGFFGQPVGTSYQISYLYQTTVTNGTSSTTILNTIAPELDTEITSATIPYLFPQCANRRTRKLQQQLWNIIRYLQSTDGTINAISSLPADQFILSGFSCIGDPSTVGDCYVVQGSMTILGSNFIGTDQVQAIVLPAIQYSIQELNSTLNINDVIEIQFISNDLTTVAPITAPPVAPNPPITSLPTPSSPTAPPNPGVVTFSPTTFDFINPTPLPVTPVPVSTPTTVAPTPSVSSFGTIKPSGIRIPSSNSRIPSDTTSGSDVPSLIPAPAPQPTSPPADRSVPSNAKKGPPFWVWVIVVIAAGGIVMCACIYQAGNPGRKRVDPNKRSAEINIRKDKNVNDQEEAYEPPPAEMLSSNNYGSAAGGGNDVEYMPPGSLGFTMTNDNNNNNNSIDDINVSSPFSNDQEDDDNDDYEGGEGEGDEDGDEGEETFDDEEEDEQEEEGEEDEEEGEEGEEYYEGEEGEEYEEGEEGGEEDDYEDENGSYDDEDEEEDYEVDEKQMGWGRQNNGFGNF